MFGVVSKPFTKQENTVIQTCVVACYGLATSGGFGSYMLAMDQKTYELIGTDYPGNRAMDVKNPSLSWMIGFMFLVSFLGIFILVALRKVMVLNYKLTYPRGTATAMFINSVHGTTGDELVEKQVSCLGKYLSVSFLWNCFKWFFSGVGDSCGFDNFPSLGLAAFKNTFYFDFSPTYIGCGLICPHIVNCSALLGATISWGFLWPYISSKAGEWYPANLGSNDFKGLYGYKVFISISLILGDGIYNLIKIIYATIKKIRNARAKQERLPLIWVQDDDKLSKVSVKEKLLNEVFLTDTIAIKLMRDVTPNCVSNFIPLPMAMAIPFYIGANFAIDMFVGTVILFVWERVNRKESEEFAGAVASGLICGDGIWSVPSAVLSILRIDPPMCMYFKPSFTYG
ncbi:hypothetical protein ZWY2020_058025 [Hordeum vulgare]|nr:hypothetical protein ZWY2020_058025 [Hordeum vulgare]